LSLLALSCASNPPKTDLEKVFKKIPDGEYTDLIEKYTRNDKRYEGFYNTYQVSATEINSKVQQALLQREGYFMQWEPSKAQSEREKAVQEMSSSSHFFVTMYTPERGLNELEKANSMWKLYLEVNGLRYKGTVKKFEKNLVQTKNLYPYFTRFNKGYVVSFEIPMTSVEKNSSVLVLTSSLGTTTFKY